MSKMKDLSIEMKRTKEEIKSEIDKQVKDMRSFAKHENQSHFYERANGLEDAKKIIDKHLKT